MDLPNDGGTEARFAAYAAELTSVLGHADRVGPFQDYCVGLLSAEGRKSVEPLAALTAPERTAAQHQSLLHIVGESPWQDEAVLTRVRELVLPTMTGAEPIQAWIVDDTGFPKKGTCSVGVARQYCGQTGKQDNCQVAVSLSVATHQASLPVAYRLYLPQDWANDAARRAKVGVPDTIRFQTKPDIALEQIRAMRAAGVPAAAVLFDPAYGNDGKFRAGITAEGLPYVAGVFATLLVWRPGEAPQPQPEGERRAWRKPGEKRPSRSRRWPWNCPPTPGRPPPGGRAATAAHLPLYPPAGARCAAGGRAQRTGGGRMVADRVAGGRSCPGPLLALHPAG